MGYEYNYTFGVRSCCKLTVTKYSVRRTMRGYEVTDKFRIVNAT
jgi:hypothetical protein